MRRHLAVLVFGLTAAQPLAGHAGGFDIPDNGTEALGRGGAFVAKADDGTALEYNVAGLARQRGTRLTLGANFLFHDSPFTRSGVYSGMPGSPLDPNAPPYAGQPYPTQYDRENFFPAPLLMLSTDFGWFKRWTFAIGLYGPPSIGKHTYAVADRAPGMTEDPAATVTLPNGMTAPAPGRYDVTKTDGLLFFPTLAVGVNAIRRYLDLGAAFQLVYVNLHLANANVTPSNKTLCGPSYDYPACDAYGNVSTTGLGFTGALSALAHPAHWLDVGATFHLPTLSRDGTHITTAGTLHPVTMQGTIMDSPATFTVAIPLWARLGARAILRYPDGSEKADLEVDLIYENWSQEKGSHLNASNVPFGPGGELNADVVHNYKDTYGVRLGGAYNYRLGDRERLIGRLGFYYDSAATDAKDTRLDFNTLDKFGFTGGLGLKWRGLGINLAYAFVYSPPRNVTNSDLTAISGTNGNLNPGERGYMVVGNGRYAPTTQILSVSLTVHFDEFRRSHLFIN